jgi:phosphoribosyl 1,2-cyclic phosphodiesterase
MISKKQPIGLRVCVLASGSAGNCIYIAADQTALLIDAGLSARETARRLQSIHADPETICGICVTHEHSDHTKGLSVLQRRYGYPVYANSGTAQGYQLAKGDSRVEWTVFTTGVPFEIGNLRIEPFAVSHDAFEPVGYVLNAGEVRLGVVTDMGIPTYLVKDKLRSCDAIIIESNHDEIMLRESPRPWNLKNRISGRQGHLSNRHAAEMIAEIGTHRLQQVFLAHISTDCNYHDLALKEMKRSLRIAGHHHIQVELTYAHQVSTVWESPAKPGDNPSYTLPETG